jgi:hypothetical protein
VSHHTESKEERRGWRTAAKALEGSGALLDIAIVDRHGAVIAVTAAQPAP